MKHALPAFLAALSLVAACGNDATFLPPDASYTADGRVSLSCVPNLDGKITSNELQAAIGVSERYLVSPAGKTEPITAVGPGGLDGTVNGNGQRVWNWSTSLSSDQDFTLIPAALSGQWYAGSFPGGQFVLPIDAADTTEGVYVHDDQAIRLLGIASTEENPAQGKTLVVYETPVILYQFPIEVGATWTSQGMSKNATLLGLPYAGVDTYATKVDASGVLVLPDYTFTQVMRVETLVTVTPDVGPPPTTQRQVSFLFECFGEVARATSQVGETNADFTVASEIRRIGAMPPPTH